MSRDIPRVEKAAKVQFNESKKSFSDKVDEVRVHIFGFLRLVLKRRIN
jgi:hypothetical protein